MAAKDIHSIYLARGPFATTTPHIRRPRQSQNRRIHVDMPLQQYPVTLFTTTYLSRSSAIRYISHLAYQTRLMEIPQRDYFLDSIDSTRQAANDQTHRASSKRGHDRPEYQSWMESI